MAEVGGVIFHREASPRSSNRWRCTAGSIFTIMRVKNCRNKEQVRRQGKEAGDETKRKGKIWDGGEGNGKRMKEDASCEWKEIGWWRMLERKGEKG